MLTDSDDRLVRYLLGELPDAEAEEMDERSITDDTFALRLRVLENDLVDRCARGEHLDPLVDRFDRLYRASPHLREKVRFAQALQLLTAKSEPGRQHQGIPPAPSRFGWWSLAAAAILLLATAGYLAVGNVRLRSELGQLEARRAAVERQHAQLQQEVERTRATPAPQLSPVTATFLLSPPRRGIGNDTTTVSVPRGTEQVTLRLRVESDDYTAFWAALRDLATTRIVRRSGDLPVEASGSDRIVTLTLPVSALVTQQYAVELFGVARGATGLVGHYPIRVVLE